MIHIIHVGVALERPPTVQQYRKYAIYGGTHADAELIALQMAACTSVMPVSIEHDGGQATVCGPSAGCKVVETDPHGAMGCRCWPTDPGADDSYLTSEGWLIDEHCPLHGELLPKLSMGDVHGRDLSIPEAEL